MAIKRIQLRGLSSSPSDRSNADGGVAESINVHIDQDETAPTLQPVDATLFLGLPTSQFKDYCYIHKQPSYTHFVAKSETGVEAFVKGEPQTCATFESGEEFKSITSLGNTLVISTDKHIHYAVFKDGEYKYLGTEIPRPKVTFFTKEKERSMGIYLYESPPTPGLAGSFAEAVSSVLQNMGYPPLTPTEKQRLTASISPYTPLKIAEIKPNEVDTFVSLMYELGVILDGSYFTAPSYFSISDTGIYDCAPDDKVFPTIGTGIGQEQMQEFWNNIIRLKDASTFAKSVLDGETDRAWGAVAALVAQAQADGYFASPVLARYSVRLYDGSFIYPSVPVLVTGKKEENFATVQNIYNHARSVNYEFYLYIVAMLNNVFSVSYNIECDLTGWEDIIESIDISLSTDLNYPASGTRIGGFKTPDPKPDYGWQGALCELSFKEDEDKDDNEIMEDIFLSKSNYYIVKTYESGTFEDKYGVKLKPVLQDKLVLKEEMKDNGDEPIVSFGFAKEYNSRLVLSDVGMSLPMGLPSFPFASQGGFDPFGPMPESNIYSAAFFVRNQGVEQLVRVSFENTAIFEFATGSYIAYPNPNCYKAVIKKDQSIYEIEMKPHPYLPIAYAVANLGMGSINDIVTAPAESFPKDSSSYKITNKVLQSDVSNPFSFPAALRYTMAADIIDMAAATTALSTGQFGAYPLYVFTSDGIWAMQTADDGTFGSSHPVSRDVALAGTITPIDQAVVFITRKGVMLLSGSEVQNLSPNMLGKPYSMTDDEVLSVLSSNRAGKFNGILSEEETPFMVFMEQAKAVYDYAGRRIIFFNEDKDYQYILYLATSTWHKATVGKRTFVKFDKVLNSYPEAYAVSKSEELGNGHLIIMDKYNDYGQLGYNAISTLVRRAWRVTRAQVDDFLFNEKGLLREAISDEDFHSFDLLCKTNGYNYETIETVKIKSPSLIYDFSTPNTESEALLALRSEQAVIVTRAMDLDNPDVLKTITRIKIRGSFKRLDENGKPKVSYILLGSQDGMTYKKLGSLHGKSWKNYRMVIVANLKPYERISWIDIDYEPRFTNKLR